MVDMVRVVRPRRGRAGLDGQTVALSRASRERSRAAGIQEKGGPVCPKRGDDCACAKVFDGVG
jgi:hypothetical protein